MGISLYGLTPATTYDALIKTGDNEPLTSALKVLSDGVGTNLPMEASTTAINFTGALQQSGVAVPTAAQVNAKQDTLVSGTNIKTINGTSVLGSGNIVTPTTSPSGVSGAIQFSNGSAFASDAANLFFDDTNNRLGVGTNAPVKTLNVVGGDVQIGSSLTSGNFNPATYRTFTIGSDYSSGALQIGNGTTGLMWGGLYANINNVAVYANSRDLTFETPVEAMRITSGRNVGIGETTPTSRLHIKGSGSTSATTSLLVQNSAGTQLLKVTDNGDTFIGSLELGNTAGYTTGVGIRGMGNVITFAANTNGGSSYGYLYGFQNYIGTGLCALDTVNTGLIRLNKIGFQSGNANNLEANTIWAEPTYNFTNASRTGTIARGFYYNPTLTSLTNTTHYGIQTTSGGAYINTSNPNASAILQADSTTTGFLPPRMTTTQKNAIATPASGLVVYDSTTNKLCCYNGSTWNDLF